MRAVGARPTTAPLVKVCGLTRPADAEAAVAAGADLVGFVFVPGTPRAVTAETVRWARSLSGAETVGVFRDCGLDEILAVRRALQLDWVQLHGAEPDAMLQDLGSNVIRCVAVAGGVDWERVLRLGERCLPLLDAGAGGGVPFDWGVLRSRPAHARFGLAGGLTPENVTAAIAVARPILVDVSSGVEQAPGLKDSDLMAAFVAATKGAVR
jgi:phosphoribosylanthranilate isomerase